MARALPSLALSALLLSCAARTVPTAANTAAERIVSVDTGAGRLRVSDGGAGEPAVVFVHGLGGDLEVWRPQLDHLRPGRQAVAYDQRGHGKSDRARDGVYTLEVLADDLEAVRKALGIRRMVLVGHSMSGAVLTTYAGRHPDRVAGLLYLDAMGDYGMYPREKLQPYVDRAKAASVTAESRRAYFAPELGPPALPATRERVLAAMDDVDPAAFAGLFAAMLDFRDARQRYAPYHGPAVAVEVAAQPEPDVAGTVLGLPRKAIPGASHWVQLDAPDAVTRELDAFLATIPAAP